MPKCSNPHPSWSRHRAAALALSLALAFAPVAAFAADAPPAGLPHFFQVSELLYRGAQPTEEGWQTLARMGVKRVIDLRRAQEHSCDLEAQAVREAGMEYVNVPMNGFETPTSDQIGKVLELLDAGGPVFIHCKLGMDRTGTVVAAYRIAHEKWANDRALSEAESRGLHWYMRGMKRFIRGFRPTTQTMPALASADSVRSGPVGAIPVVAER